MMNAVDQAYHPALVIPPADIAAGVRFFSGEDLLAKTQANQLSTVDADGWSRVSLLSVGEIVFRPGEGFRFCVYRQSTTAANLARDGRATISLALDGGLWEMRLRTTACEPNIADPSHAFFKATIDGAHVHTAPYAKVTSGITFSMHEPSTVLARWKKQLTTLRAIS
jgi:hypothetical protein